MSSDLSVHFSSASGEWETPDELFNPLNEEFHFVLDVCASELNHKCDRYYDIATDGLAQPWDVHGGYWWCNPPYGREVILWVRKAVQEISFGNKGVMLLPARTDTGWWSLIWDHEKHCPRKYIRQIRFIRGRIKFVNRSLPSFREDGNFKVSPAPFPSAIVIFDSSQI